MLKKFLSFVGKRSLIMSMSLFIAVSYVDAREVVLKSGTAIPMQLVNTVNGKDVAVGQIVDFRVTSDIKVDGVTVIPAKPVSITFFASK